jgi:hypothetical protein
LQFSASQLKIKPVRQKFWLEVKFNETLLKIRREGQRKKPKVELPADVTN